MSFIKSLFLLIILLILVLFGAIGFYLSQSLSPVPISFSLKAGSGLKSSVHQMQQAGVLSQEWAFVLLARALDKSALIKPGNYQLTEPTNPLQLLDLISNGRIQQTQISIIEGWSFKQLRAALNADTALLHDSMPLSDAEIMQRIGAIGTEPEGLFFPDTYRFASGSSDFVILKKAYQLLESHLQQSWKTRAPNLPLASPYQALILASIVEKETGQASDRPMIAAVFINRLNKKMLLQTDPTVIYGLGEHFDGNLRKRDLQTDTPYNTYTRAGLTPTPIALPGLASIEAVLHPAVSDALYFVAKGDGSSYFSSTLLEHNNAVNHFQK